MYFGLVLIIVKVLNFLVTLSTINNNILNISTRKSYQMLWSTDTFGGDFQFK